MTSQAPTQGPTDAGLTTRVLSSEWQPIETAPNEGTLILACEGDDVFIVQGDYVAHYWVILSDGYFIVPTHWMPLPTPPINPKGAA